MIDTLVDVGFPAKVCCRKLDISSPGYYKYQKRSLPTTKMRHQWLTGLIREVHIASRGTYGSRRVHAELTLGMGVRVSERLIAVLMHNADITGLPGLARVKRLRGVASADDLVNRKFHRLSPNELWVTNITEHPRNCYQTVTPKTSHNGVRTRIVPTIHITHPMKGAHV